MSHEMSHDQTEALAIDPADQQADQVIMKHLTIVIGVMMVIALAIGFTANTIA